MSKTQSRMTRQRRVILEELCKVNTHPTADEVYTMVKGKLPNISLGTVYRNLDLLAENNQILKLETAGNTRRYDANIEPHSHVRCLSCGKVLDIPYIDTSKLDLKGDCLKDFNYMNVRVEIDGICAECAEKEKH